MPVQMNRPGMGSHKAPSFTLEGGEVLARLLKDFPHKIRETILDGAVGAGATVIKKAAQKNLKQNGSVKTGNLLRSLKTQKVKKAHGIYRIFTQGPRAPKNQRGPHAHLVEFGTGPRRLKKPHYAKIGDNWVWLEHTGSMPAKPFFRPALDENKPEVLRAMMLRMAKRMAKEAEKMARSYRTLSKSYKKRLAA